MRRIWEHVTPSMAVAIAALVVALSGTAVAAKQLIDGRDIRRNSIAADRLTRGAIRSLRGQRGAAGPAGARGPAGVAGPARRGRSGGRGRSAGREGAQGPPGAGSEIIAQVGLAAPVTVQPNSSVTVPLTGASWTQEPARHATAVHRRHLLRASGSLQPRRPRRRRSTSPSTATSVGSVPIGGALSPWATTPLSGTDFAPLAPPAADAARTATARLTNPCTGAGESFVHAVEPRRSTSSPCADAAQAFVRGRGGGGAEAEAAPRHCWRGAGVGRCATAGGRRPQRPATRSV